MKPLAHHIYLSVLALIVVLAIAVLLKVGLRFYLVPLEERFFNENYEFLKPGGAWGHGIGIIGSFCMLAGVGLYSARKRIRRLNRIGILKHWLEFHIFLCTLGPFMILFHTSFKFGGLVAISFWSMVAVFLSGVIGRYIYIQIPRTIEGRELNLNEVRELKNKLELVRLGIKDKDTKEDHRLARQELRLSRKIDRLSRMQQLFRYWHVAHIPFAIIMLIIMIIHVAVTLILGYRWIF